MANYAWTISKDNVQSGELKGTVGPRSTTKTARQIRRAEDRTRFRLLDADERPYFYGFLVGDATGFEPRDDFGLAFGAVYIEERIDGEWVRL